MAAILSGSPREVELAMIDYGRHLGTAFQLVDDALDYSASAEELGKNLGDDLAEGKPTLPVIYALSNSPAADAALLRSAIENGGIEDLAQITRRSRPRADSSTLRGWHGGRRNSRSRRSTGCRRAAYRNALVALAEFAVARTY